MSAINPIKLVTFNLTNSKLKIKIDSRQDFIKRSTDMRLSLRKINLEDILSNKRHLNDVKNNLNDYKADKYEVILENLDLVQKQRDSFEANVINVTVF